MNNPDRLDRLLRDDARVAIADDGFTRRVMGALPARAPRLNPWLKPVLVLGSTALGCALAAAFAPADNNVVQGFLDLATMRGFTPAAFTGLAMAGALLISAIVLAVDTE
jgi:hypothetical protein